jgi:putative transposase
MSIGGYKIRNQKEAHFISFAVCGWIDVFTRKEYRDIIVASLKFCQQNKGLVIHAWCIMPNHMHLIISSQEGKLSATLRDFKKFTSCSILNAIGSHPKESRREWMLSAFKNYGSGNSRNTVFQFWQQSNCPMETYSAPFIKQKLDYLHKNPVKAGWVEKPEHYLYSSARSYVLGKSAGLIDVSFI